MMQTVDLCEIANWLRGEAKEADNLDDFDYFADLLDRVARGDLRIEAR